MTEPQTVAAIATRSALYTRPDWLLDIALFHERFEQAHTGLPRGLPEALATFRFKFMEEELNEWYDNTLALAEELKEENPDPDRVNGFLELSLDGLVDLMYVVLGTAYQQGFFPIIEEAWSRVQKANMSKIKKLKGNGTEIESGRNPEYDVVKPVDFVAPRHIDLVSTNVHNL